MGNILEKQYSKEGKIGQGAFGQVFKCQRKVDEVDFCVKIIQTSHLTKEDKERVKREKMIL